MRRWRLVPTFLAALLIPLPGVPLSAQAETGAQAVDSAEEVLDEHFEAIGGREMIESIDSAEVTGTMTMGPGMEAPFTVYWQDPDKVRIEFTVQGTTGVRAYDGEVGWMHMPFMGAAEPQRMPEDQIEQMEQQADMIEGPLFDYREKGHTVEYLGTEEIEGTEAHVLKLTLKNGDERTIYLDADHFLQFRSESTMTQGDQEVEIVTSYGNFKEVDGYVLPHSMTTKLKNAPAEAPAQTMTVESFEFGADVSDVQFSMPEAAATESETETEEGESAPASIERDDEREVEEEIEEVEEESGDDGVR